MQGQSYFTSDRHFDSGVYASLKRAIDIVLAAAGLVLSMPLVLLCLALVALDGHSPLFTHMRVGKGGRAFPCYKIRTMRPYAEQRLGELLANDPQAAAAWEARQKIPNDPRVTWVGGILRQARIDELPQFMNVLRGDMSLVGPRPITRNELQRYGAGASAYLSVRPGLTGAWQSVGRRDLAYKDRIDLDLAYVAKMSLMTDLLILLRTVRVVLRRFGE